MMNHSVARARLVIVMLALMASCAMASASVQEQPGSEIPWAVQLGSRVANVRNSIPMVDHVVLVPDEATYLRELQRWSPEGRWPVLIEDNHFAPLFVRAFAPKQLIRRPSVLTGTEADVITPEALDAVVISTFGGTVGTHSVNDVFRLSGWDPPGVVITSLDDPAWTAAVALAAGRGQPITYLDGFQGLPDHTFPSERAFALRDAVRGNVESTGFAFGELGRDIDTITICRDVAGKVRVTLPSNQTVSVSGANTNGGLATTDFLGRGSNGEREAFVGWIFGDATRAAYMAMSALFLGRENVHLYNSYQESGQWQVFSMKPALPILQELEFDLQSTIGTEATPNGWRRLIQRGLESDVMFINSKGNADWFQLRGGPVDCYDVPVLHRPLALHMVHSWSLTAPTAPGTIGERWLRNGVYAYIGSAHEPYLGAFIPPELVVRRCVSGTPFLVAGRHWNGPYGHAWRVQTIGDPLMLWVAESQLPRRRIVSDDRAAGEDVRAALPALMRAGAEDPQGPEAARALRTLFMLGEDAIGAQFWDGMASMRPSSDAARAAMPILHRLGRHQDVMTAFLMLDQRDVRAVDMVWQSWGPQLRGRLDESTVSELIGAIRPEWPHADIKRLATSIEQTFGRAHVRTLIDRYLQRDPSPGAKVGLEKLRNEYR
ncbi:MAG: hypothetical protein AAF432_01150 [Planctomycetota bacterium]